MKSYSRVFSFLLLTYGLGFVAPPSSPTAEPKAPASRTPPSEAPADLVARGESGDPEAEFELGRFFLQRSTTPTDLAQASRWLRRSAEQGYAPAQTAFGLLWIQGLGVPKDFAEAARWLRQAALQGDAAGQLELGVMHVNGEGMPANLVEGYAWYSLAAQQGNAQAKQYLADLERLLSRSDIAEARKRTAELEKLVEAERQKRLAAAKPRHRHGSPLAVLTTNADTGEPSAAAPSQEAPPDRTTPVPEAKPSSGSANRLVRLKPLNVFDSGIGTEAFSILIPEGWKAEGGVLWLHNFANLASMNLRVSSPDETEALQVFPVIPYYWQEGGVPFFNVGQNYLGQEVRPPIRTPDEFIQQVILPQYRPGVVARRARLQSLPDLADAVAKNIQEPGIKKSVQAAAVRFEYLEGGREMEEEFFCVMVYSTSDVLPNATMWGAERVLSFKAPRGKLDEISPTLFASLQSTRLNPRWFAGYLQVIDLWRQGQYQAIRNAGELSRYISKTSNEISDLHRQAYRSQQEANDRVYSNFSKYIRGVEHYQHPTTQQEVTLPSGYDHVWVSNRGEYILSSRAGFDPNLGSTETWQLMKPTPQ